MPSSAAATTACRWLAAPSELGLKPSKARAFQCTAEHLVAQQDGGRDVSGMWWPRMPDATSAGTSARDQLLPLKRSGPWFRSGWQWKMVVQTAARDCTCCCMTSSSYTNLRLIRLAPRFTARNNKIDDPIDVWLDGRFDDWQCWQRQRNFDRDLVLSLVQIPNTYRWMFAGLFRSVGSRPDVDANGTPHVDYTLERIDSTLALEGRLFVTGKYVSRTSYLRGETLSGDMVVHELLAEKLGDGEFPGFGQVDIDKDTLDRVVASGNNSWRAALSSVKGIYLLTDSKTGLLYVGKADGDAGIWGRWCQYSSTGHGWNKALVQEFGIKATDRQRDLRFSILEVMDRRSQESQIDKRESHWKRILMSRNGYNRN